MPVLLLGGAAVVWAAATVAFGSAYDHRVLALAGLYALNAIGYQFTFGHAGALSLAQGAFFGLGAYVTAILGTQFGWGFAATFPAAIASAALLAALVAAPVLRLASHYFALATLAIAQMLWLAATNWEEFTGGANGLPGVPPVTIVGAVLPSGLPFAVLVWAIVGLGVLVAWRALRGLWGHAFALARHNALAAAASGLDVGALRATAFVLSAAYGGAAGALQAHAVGVVSPDVLGFATMVLTLAIVVVGGRTSLAGAVLAAIVLVHLPEWLRPLSEGYLLAVGVLLLAIVAIAPDGLFSAARRLMSSGSGPSATPPPHPSLARVEGEAMRSPVTSSSLAREGWGGGASDTHDAPALAVDDLAKSYGGIVALAGVSLTVAAGEIVGLVGPNGSGKTTLVNLASGIDRPDRGRVRVGGKDVADAPSHRIARAGLARSFQTPDLPPGLSVLDAVAAACAAVEGAGFGQALAETGADPALAHARARAAAVLARLDLADRADQPCGAQPHGVRRRIDIARALATGPAALLLDEPAAGLTAEGRAALSRLLRAEADGGLAVLVVEHDADFLAGLADRLVCLVEGRVVAAGPTADILTDPAVVAAWLGAGQ